MRQSVNSLLTVELDGFPRFGAPKRGELLPDVPTFAEGGVNDVYVRNWRNVMAGHVLKMRSTEP